MMGQQPRTEPLFYYFRLEDQIPEHHLLRRIDRYVDFSFVQERLRGAYSRLGRPSIDGAASLSPSWSVLQPQGCTCASPSLGRSSKAIGVVVLTQHSSYLPVSFLEWRHRPKLG